jgi:hypothetical protein
MISLLISLIVIGLILWLILWAAEQIPMPDSFRVVIRVIIALIGVVILLRLLGGVAGLSLLSCRC